jgi:16S rRNA processing protein RimM
MTNKKKRIVGKFQGAHGIKGEVKIYPLVDDPNKLLKISEIYSQDKTYSVLSSRPHKNSLLFFLEGISDRSSAELLSDYVEAEIEDELAEGEFYIEDLKTLDVYNSEDSSFIGKLKSVSDSAQMHLFIQIDESELIVPFVKEYIKRIDMAEKKIFIKLDQDLLELNK